MDNNQKQWEEEYFILSTAISQKVKIGRQHFLRFEIPTTWQIWEDNNMEWDSTLTYPGKEGFRGGTCYEYSVFNSLSRKKLKLKEMPLTVMEGTMVGYQNLVPVIMEKRIIKLTNNVKKLYPENEGFKRDIVYCSRSINSNPFGRSLIQEFLISNYNKGGFENALCYKSRMS